MNFGDLYIPADLDFPQPHVIGSLQGQHGVTSGPIVVVDAQTILVPDFTYDGQAPGEFRYIFDMFWDPRYFISTKSHSCESFYNTDVYLFYFQKYMWHLTGAERDSFSFLLAF